MSTSKLWTVSFDDMYPTMRPSLHIPWVTRAGNNTLVLSSGKVWSLGQKEPQMKASLPKDFPYSVHFVKSIEWQKQLFLLACLKSKCSLFNSSLAFDFVYCQSISDDAGFPIDAEFFVHHGDLFLTVLFRASNNTLSQTRMYRWRKTFMDPELDSTEITSTASSITIFKYEDKILFVLGCSGDDNLKFMSQVWSREADGEMRKVQYLPTSKPLSITHFVERGEHFVLVQDQNQGAAIYWWEGSEFVKWMDLEDTWKYFKVSVSRSIPNLPTFLICTHGTSLNIYFMTSKKLEKVFMTDEFQRTEMLPQNWSIKTMTLYEEARKSYLLVLTTAQNKDYLTLFLVAIDRTSVDTVTEVPINTDIERQGSLAQVLHKVNELQDQGGTLDATMNTVLLTNRQATINSSYIRVSEKVEVRSGEIWNVIHRNMDISVAIQYIFSRISPLRADINTHIRTLQSTIPHQNKHIFYFNTVHLRQAKINSLMAHTVNNKPFKPDFFWSVKKKQNLFSIKAKTLKVDWLVAEQIGNKSVKGMLLEDNLIRGPVQVDQLEAEHLEMSENATINNLTARDLKNKAATVERSESILNKTQEEEVMAKEPSMVTTLKLQDHTIIENLNVDLINNTDVNRLLASLFINGFKNVIDGSLSIKGDVQVNELVYNKLTERSPVLVYPSVQNFGLYLRQPSLDVHQPFSGRGIYKRDTNNESRPVKVYKTRVKILGNLKVGQLIFENSSLSTSRGPVPTVDLEKKFWTHHTPQVIPGAVHFSQGVTLLQGLDNPVVNDKNLTQYASTRTIFRSLVLENIHVTGNISTNDNHFHIKRDLNYDVVEVKHLHTEYINGKHMKNIVHMGQLVNNEINIITESLHVKGNLRADQVNGIDIQRKFESAVLINEDFTSPQLTLANVSAKVVEAEYLNNYRTDELKGFGGSGVRGSRVFEGNLAVSQLLGVITVNNKPVNLSLVVNSNKDTVICGKKSFPGQVQITNNITVEIINNVDVEEMFRNLLVKSADQKVTGFFTIRKGSMKSLHNISEINHMDPSKFVYVDQPQLNLTSDLDFTSLVVEGNLTATSLTDSCVLPKVEEQTVIEQASTWASLQIIGDSEWSEASGPLQRMLQSAVTTSGDQLITGVVSVGDIQVKSATIHTLNNKNLTFTIQDALLRHKGNQVITGKKHFSGSFKCKNIDAKGRVWFHSANDADIHDIDRRIVRRVIDDDAPNIPVFGHKTFLSGFKTFKLTCPDGINGIPASALARHDYQGVLPRLVVPTLKVLDNLQVNTINGLHIDSFLQDCVYKNFSANQIIKYQMHVIGNVSLEGTVSTPNINNIPISSLVFVKNEKVPTVIRGCKTFTKNIQIETDSEVGILNGVNLYATYKNSIKNNQDAIINGSVVILSAVEMDTIYAQNYTVGSKELVKLTQTIAP